MLGSSVTTMGAFIAIHTKLGVVFSAILHNSMLLFDMYMGFSSPYFQCAIAVHFSLLCC